MATLFRSCADALGANSIRASSTRSSTRCRNRGQIPFARNRDERVARRAHASRFPVPHARRRAPRSLCVVAVQHAVRKIVGADQENLERAAIDDGQLGSHLIGHTDHPGRQASSTFPRKPTAQGPARGGSTGASRSQTPAGPRRVPCRTRSIVRHRHHTCLAVIEALRRTVLIRARHGIACGERRSRLWPSTEGSPLFGSGACVHNSIPLSRRWLAR